MLRASTDGVAGLRRCNWEVSFHSDQLCETLEHLPVLVRKGREANYLAGAGGGLQLVAQFSVPPAQEVLKRYREVAGVVGAEYVASGSSLSSFRHTLLRSSSKSALTHSPRTVSVGGVLYCFCWNKLVVILYYSGKTALTTQIIEKYDYYIGKTKKCIY